MKHLRSEDEIIKTWDTAGTQPVVSICCITYNHEDYIEDALNGFLIQETDFPIEILIHDDASTDRTSDIIRNYQANYPKIVKPIYQTENQFSHGKRMNADFNFTRAKGDYLAICEGDDYWVDTSKLQKQVNYLIANPSYVLTFTDALTFNSEGIIESNLGGATRDLSAEELIVGTPIKTLTACFKNVFKEKAWPAELRNAYYGDLTMWSLLGDHGAGKYLSDISPSMYRVHNESIHSSIPQKTRYRNYLQTLFCLYLYRVTQADQRAAKLIAAKIIRHLVKELSLIDVVKIFTGHCITTLKAFLK
ncbi:glycosyltransferase [Methylophaga sp.]|uniref:glycosyltransferase family 2 protein n=1 Tax=Methylophaga sp. TaxID=2024840 RepID=UPI001400969B|nr:glycosyltransferase [Methylophaga sp.]MTI64683.1 glycosyltransferase [Methylophaga sp.]